MTNCRTHTRVGFALVLFLIAGAAGSAEEAKPPAPPPPEVTVVSPSEQRITDFDEYVGRFVAVDYVEVRAQVSGYLQAIHFQDGQLVTVGAPLFTIDPRPFQATLDQVSGALEQARANESFTGADLKRGEGLPRGLAITQQTFDQRVQANAVAKSNVAAQEAAKRQAELNLQFTELKAPIAGRIGDRRVSVGNLVSGGSSSNTTLLATITSVDPIRFEFTADEASYLKYLRNAQSTSDVKSANRGLSLPVHLKLIDETGFQHEGHITFVDNAIDTSSGTIRIRAEFANPDGRFTPGMFGRVQVASGPPEDALLVPDAAIGTEQIRKFVYVLGPGNVVESKYVTTGTLSGELRVIKSGLARSDKVVTTGLMRLRPGATVAPKAAAEPARSEAGPN